MTDDIAETLTRWEEVLGAVTRLGQRNRRMVRWLAISFAFDIVLTIGVGWNTLQYHHSTAAQQHTTCLAGNAFRTADKARWEYVLNLSTPTTPQQVSVDARFRAYLDKTEKLRKC